MPKILIIEDEAALREEILDILSCEGFSVAVAENGKAGLELAQVQHPDLILCDVMMPLLNGYELLEALRQNLETATIPFIFLTAKGSHENIRQGMNLGADDYLIKPFSIEDLLNAIAARLTKQHKTLGIDRKDPFTQLPTEAYLLDRLNHLNQQGSIEQKINHVLLLIGIDRFREIRDVFGPSLGNQFLQWIATQLRDFLRPDDLLIHFGGDEFVILSKNVPDLLVAVQLADQIYKWSLTQALKLDSCQVSSSVSIGITHGQFPCRSVARLLADASLAMHQARSISQKGYVVFDPVMQINLSEKLQLETDFKQAIFQGISAGKQEEFCLHYQPIINLTTSDLVGFEALIRWNSHNRGTVSPAEFIPIAETSGLIDELGWWVIQEACCQLQRWRHQFPACANLFMNVNLSPVQLDQINFTQRLADILKFYYLSNQHLKLEITESCLLEITGNKQNVLESLSMSKVRLCIDDFGTGYSCLSRLHKLSIDTLKIDRSFVSEIDSASQNSVIQAIIALARGLDINVVAEGIETPFQMEKLKELDCQMGQGYFFAKPLNQKNATRFIIDKLLTESSNL